MSRRAALAFVLLGSGVAAVFAGKALAPDAAAYRSVFTEPVLLRLGGVTKLLLLWLAWLFAARTGAGLDRDNPARLPWRLFAFGLLGFLGGQAVLSAYQVIGGVSPYPSPGDASTASVVVSTVKGAAHAPVKAVAAKRNDVNDTPSARRP